MRPIETLSRIAKTFRRDARGNFGMMLAVVAPVLAIGAGYGLNIAQISLTRSNLLAALDSAVTSTARDLTTGTIEEKDAHATVEAFLLANGTRGYAEDGKLSLDSVVVDKAASTVTARASVLLDVAFPLFGTANRQKVTTESAAVYSDKKIEIVMMLDITGSMAGQKIRDLRSAARNAVDTFLGGQRADSQRVRVALVPYADSVNAGVLSRTVYVEQGRSSPSQPPPLDPRDITYVSGGGSGGAAPLCATDREGDYQFSDAGPGVSMVNRDYRLQFCPTAALMPLTTDRQALKARIDGLSANGHTAGQIGIQWSWYMLSPEWARALPAASAPEAYGDRKAAKFAILMTDGEFNTAFANVEHGQTVRSQPAKSRSYAERLCTEMKKKGIEVFTVGFQLREAAAKGVMKACASPDSGSVKHYFEASTGDELNAAYQTIAANIERLALTK